MQSLINKELVAIRYYLQELHLKNIQRKYIELESRYHLYIKEERTEKASYYYFFKYSHYWIKVSHHNFHFLLGLAFKMITDSYYDKNESDMGWIDKESLSFIIDGGKSSGECAYVTDQKNKLKSAILYKDPLLFNLIENNNRGSYRLRINPTCIILKLKKYREFFIAEPENLELKVNIEEAFKSIGYMLRGDF